MWLIGAQQFFRAAAQVFFGTWFGTFLADSPGISEGEVAVLAASRRLAHRRLAVGRDSVRLAVASHEQPPREPTRRWRS